MSGQEFVRFSKQKTQKLHDPDYLKIRLIPTNRDISNFIGMIKVELNEATNLYL